MYTNTRLTPVRLSLAQRSTNLFFCNEMISYHLLNCLPLIIPGRKLLQCPSPPWWNSSMQIRRSLSRFWSSRKMYWPSLVSNDSGWPNRIGISPSSNRAKSQDRMASSWVSEELAVISPLIDNIAASQIGLTRFSFIMLVRGWVIMQTPLGFLSLLRRSKVANRGTFIFPEPVGLTNIRFFIWPTFHLFRPEKRNN